MSDSESDSTEPDDNERVKDLMMKEMMRNFDRIENNMKDYFYTQLTEDMEKRIYKTLQVEIRERLKQISESISEVKSKVEDLEDSLQLKYDVILNDGRQGRSILDKKIEEIGNYDFDSVNGRSNRRWKIHEEISRLRQRMQLVPNQLKRSGWFSNTNEELSNKEVSNKESSKPLLLTDVPSLNMKI